MPLSPRTAQHLARGRELFNSGFYFEAHEAWEDAWLRRVRSD
jgi:predicted metal-dependent hydrolase